MFLTCLTMIIIDYYNFLYSRYVDINEVTVKRNLKLLSTFFAEKHFYVKIVFDGIYFQDIIFVHEKISLLFSSNKTADDIIKDLFKKLYGKANMLISRDKNLTTYIKRTYDARIIDPILMWKQLDMFSKFLPQDHNQRKSSIKKTTDYVDEELDNLYEGMKK